MIIEKAPGKLFLAGEYAVTNTGQTSIILAIDRYITVTLTERTDDSIRLSNEDFTSLSVELIDLPTLKLAGNWSLGLRTLQVVDAYLKCKEINLPAYDIKISSDLKQDNQKLGLGSSAALVVAILRAVLRDTQVEISNDNLFKLGVLITLTTPPFHGGSMGDIAAAVYGGTIHYQKFDGDWLKKELDDHSVLELVSIEWPELAITPINFPSDWQLLVGWTQKEANTQDMLAVNPELAKLYRRTLSTKSTPLVNKLALAISDADFLRVATLMRLNQEALKLYAKAMHLNYLTDRLKMLMVIAHKFGAATKISGAGGGDNGLAIVKSAEKADKIRDAWEKHGITPLDLSIAPERGTN